MESQEGLLAQKEARTQEEVTIEGAAIQEKKKSCACCQPKELPHHQKPSSPDNDAVFAEEDAILELLQASVPVKEPPSQEAPGDAPPPKKAPCTKGCCKKKEDPMGSQSQDPAISTDPSALSVKPRCTKGCCKKKEEAQEARDSQVVQKEEQPPEEGLPPPKAPCTKGCCRKKDDPVASQPEAFPPLHEDPNPSSVKPPCTKGCCKKKEDPVLQEPPPLVEDPSPSGTMPPCTKGCCEKPVVEAQPVTQEPAPSEPPSKSCKDDCCDPSSPGAKALHPLQEHYECCPACWAGKPCCTSACCGSRCCVIASVLPQKQKKQKKSSATKHPNPGDDPEIVMGGLEEKSTTSQFVVENIDCADCATTIISHLMKVSGVKEVGVKVVISLVTVVHVPDQGATEDVILENLALIGHPGRASGSASLEVVFPEVKGLEDLRPIITVLVAIPSVTNAKLRSLKTPNTLVISVDSSSPQGSRNLLRFLEEKGFPCKLADPPAPDDATTKERNYWAWATLGSFVFAIPCFIIEFFLTENQEMGQVLAPGLTVSVLVTWILATPIQFYFCNRLYTSAYRSLMFAGKPNMDVLVVMSSLTAYLYSMAVTIAALSGAPPQGEIFFGASAILLALIALGRFLEAVTKGHAVKLLVSLLTLQPVTAILVENEKESEIDVRLVQAGDILKVLPGARIAVDGTVVSGALSIDQAMLTGESLPVAKCEGDPLFAGTLNISGSALFRAKGSIAENSVSQLVQLVQGAENSKPKTARFADLAAAWFTPIAISIAVLVFVIWISLSATGIVGVDSGSEPLPFSLHFALAVLVVSCPCALALASPVAIMVGSTVASRLHILIKGGAAMETCYSVDTIVFDKTGTLTIGKPEITALFPEDPEQQANFMRLVASVEQGSEHVLAKVLVAWGKGLGLEIRQPANVQTTAGQGVQGTVDGQVVTVGSRRWLTACNVKVPDEMLEFETRLSAVGSTIVFAGVEGVCVGAVALADQVKPEASGVIEELHNSARQVWMLSGDNRYAALAVAQRLGIPDSRVVYEATPADKIDHVKRLQREGCVVMMIGDGINDAPALTQANVGVAVGAGTDITQNSAQIVLSRDHLGDLWTTLDLCRVIYQRIRINIFWAFLYNIVAIPLAAGVFYPVGFSIPPAFSGISELLSSVPVLVSSILLVLYRPPKMKAFTEMPTVITL